jgi:hypothetical protein
MAGYYDNKHAYAGQLNSFTHLRALLVLNDRGIYMFDRSFKTLLLYLGLSICTTYE